MKNIVVARFVLACCLGLTSALMAQSSAPLPTSSAATEARSVRHGRQFENQDFAIALLPGWTVAATDEQARKKTGDCCVVSFIRGKYVLSINPVFMHPSGGIGGRLNEILGPQPSVVAIAGDDDLMDYVNGCIAWRDSPVSKAIGLRSYYVDIARSKDCKLPASAEGAWFASVDSGEGPESDYSIALTYNATDLDALPHRDTPELNDILREVTSMLGTLRFRPPIVVSKILPAAASPGATVTIFGSGFRLFDHSPEIFFTEDPNNFISAPEVADDGRSMTFRVPTSLQITNCPSGMADVHETCVPVSPNLAGLAACPPSPGRAANFCGVPMPAGTYHIEIRAEDVFTPPVAFRVTAPEPTAVSIRLLYPNYLVREGESITVIGSGFTPSGNTLEIGTALITGLASPDGKTLTFPAPAPAGVSLAPGLRYYEAFVANSSGRSNAILFSYR